MPKNNLVLLLKSSSPLDCPILAPLVSFISLFALVEAGLVLSLGSLTLNDIDHVSIMKSSVFPTLKRGGITSQSDPHILMYIGSQTLIDPNIGILCSKTKRY